MSRDSRGPSADRVIPGTGEYNAGWVQARRAAIIIAVGAILVILVMMFAGEAGAQPVGGIVDEVRPDPSLMTPELQRVVVRWISWVWYILLALGFVRIVWGAIQIRQDQHAGKVASFTEGASELKGATIAFAVCASATVFVKAILFLTTG
jgi:type IV secretion system pilin